MDKKDDNFNFILSYTFSIAQHRVFKYIKSRIMLAREIQTYMLTFRSVMELIFSLTLHFIAVNVECISLQSENGDGN